MSLTGLECSILFWGVWINLCFPPVGFLREMILDVRTESGHHTERRGGVLTSGAPPLMATLVILIPTTVLPISRHPEVASMEDEIV